MADTQPSVTAAKQIALMMYSNEPDVLAVFGLAPRKTPTPLTIEQKAERAAKAKATRIARNTMGPKAKAKVKGTVTTTPAATASGSATTPVTLPSTASSVVTGTGH